MLHIVKYIGFIDFTRIEDFYVTLIIFQSYHNLEAGDTQSVKLYWQDWGSNPGPFAPQAKNLTTTPLPLCHCEVEKDFHC